MKLLRLSLLTVLAAAMLASVAYAAFPLRSPQVPFSNSALQTYLAGKGQVINTLTGQVDGQIWASSLAGKATFTFMLEATPSAPFNSIGIYNRYGWPSPTLFQVFPGAATVGWYATVSFNVVAQTAAVQLFDMNDVYQGTTHHVGVDGDNFGFYISRPGALFYSQDIGNPGGAPQILTYPGSGQSTGQWWECFEDHPYVPATSQFVSAVLEIESTVPVATHSTSWGRLKGLYR